MRLNLQLIPLTQGKSRPGAFGKDPAKAVATDKATALLITIAARVAIMGDICQIFKANGATGVNNEPINRSYSVNP